MPARLTRDGACDWLCRHGPVFVAGASGTPAGLLDHLAGDPGRSTGLDLVTSLVPGINRLAIDRLHPTARVTGLFAQPAFQAAQADGRFRMLVTSHGGFLRHLRERAGLAGAVVMLTPPDAAGRCSLGPCAEFAVTAMAHAATVLGVINPSLPRLADAPTVAYANLDAVVEFDEAPAAYDLGTPDAAAAAIAGHIAGLIEDGAALQVGLGKVPGALLAALRDRRGLRLFSGMLGDELLDLDAAGSLDPEFAHTACALVGSAGFYARLDGYDGIAVRGCEVTHDMARLTAIAGFTAVNSAVEVDLLGQANAEMIGGRAVSGAGGAPDFARAARLTRGGRSIVALSATAGREQVSRIVPRLGTGAVCSIPRHDIDLIVTEYGVADLRGRSVHERAEAVVQVAAPMHRETLAAAWREIARTL
jgi:acyl-CoA hydrolase